MARAKDHLVLHGWSRSLPLARLDSISRRASHVDAKSSLHEDEETFGQRESEMYGQRIQPLIKRRALRLLRPLREFGMVSLALRETNALVSRTRVFFGESITLLCYPHSRECIPMKAAGRRRRRRRRSQWQRGSSKIAAAALPCPADSKSDTLMQPLRASIIP